MNKSRQWLRRWVLIAYRYLPCGMAYIVIAVRPPSPTLPTIFPGIQRVSKLGPFLEINPLVKLVLVKYVPVEISKWLFWWFNRNNLIIWFFLGTSFHSTMSWESSLRKCTLLQYLLYTFCDIFLSLCLFMYFTTEKITKKFSITLWSSNNKADIKSRATPDISPAAKLSSCPPSRPPQGLFVHNLVLLQQIWGGSWRRSARHRMQLGNKFKRKPKLQVGANFIWKIC